MSAATTSPPVAKKDDNDKVVASATKKKKKKKKGPLGPDWEYRRLSAEESDRRTKRFPLPIFCAVWLRDGTVLLAGGGGTKGMGVASGVNVCEVVPTDHSPTKGRLAMYLRPYAEMTTADTIVYNMCERNGTMTAGVGSDQHMWKAGRDDIVPQVSFRVEEGECGCESAITSKGDLLATGGDDKTVRLWALPVKGKGKITPPKPTVLGKMSGDVSTMHFNHDGTRLVTSCNKNYCAVWDTSKGCEDGKDECKDDEDSQPFKKLEVQGKKGKAMRFAGCRFARSEETGEEFLLCCVNDSATGPSYVAQFDATTFELVQKVYVDKQPLSLSAVSHNGEFLAVVTLEKTYILDTLTLKKTNTVQHGHDLPASGLCFSPDDTIVLSASADRSTTFVPVRAPAGSFCANFFKLLLNALVVLLLAFLVQHKWE